MRTVPDLRLATVSDKRSDDFHRALTKWRSGDRDVRMRRTCAMLAKAYRCSLDTQIRSLEATKSSTETMIALQHTRSLRKILERDLAMWNIH